MDLKQLTESESLLRPRSDSFSTKLTRCSSNICNQSKSVWIIGLLFMAQAAAIVVLIILLHQSNSNNNNSNPGFNPNPANNNNNPIPQPIGLLQSQYLSNVSPTAINNYIDNLASKTHIAGTIDDYNTAVYVSNQLTAAGIPIVQIEQFNVLLSTPISVAMSAYNTQSNSHYTAVLEEAVYPLDPTSGLSTIKEFLAYSASGIVNATLIYANYGSATDFNYLRSKNIKCDGCVVIMRYGNIFRGNKVSGAQAFGAAAAILYIDPADTGYSRGPVYTNGSWTPATGVQRGTVWNGNGDVLTPGWASTNDTYRIPFAQTAWMNQTYGTPLPQILALPISYSDAEFLLAGLTGLEAPPEWNGGLKFKGGYHIGSGKGDLYVLMNISMNNTITPIWNVIGSIPGSIESDRSIILGNHRDAWTFGAADPISGTAVLLETARGLGSLYLSGWRPRRSIYFCSWDAEEYALIGSTEHTERYSILLMQQAIAYINVDIAATGLDYLDISGIPSLSQLIRNITKQIPAAKPNNKIKTLYDAWLLSYANTNKPILDAGDMGTGSDYGSFINHLGIASIDMRYESNDNAYESVYHSNYDSIYYYKHFIDPDLKATASIVKLEGLIALRLSTDLLLDYSYTDYIELLLRDFNHINATNIHKYPELEFSCNSTYNSLIAMQTAATTLDTLLAPNSQLQNYLYNGQLDNLYLRQINDGLVLAERGFLWLQGLPGREWYRHLIWAPALNDLYGGSAFSPIIDILAIKPIDMETAKLLLSLTTTVIQQVTDQLNSIINLAILL